MFTYRLFQDADLAGILKLWETSSGWGSITEQQFYDWYIHTPYGPCLTVLALNQREEIVGQKVFMPREVLIRGIRYRVLRAVAPILAEEVRLPNMLDPAHPILAMFRHAAEQARQQGYVMIYSLPAYGWSAWMKAFYRFKLPPWQLAVYGGFRLNAGPGTPDKHRWSVSEVLSLGPDWDDFFAALSADTAHAAGFYRSRAWINWKHAGDRLFVFYHKAVPQGYIALKPGTNLILDAQAAAPEAVAAMVSTLLHQDGGPDTVTGMRTPALEQALQPPVSSYIDYSFVYGMYPLTDAVGVSCFQPGSWNLFPGD